MKLEAKYSNSDSSRLAVVLVRDHRYRVGGFETWVETLTAGLRGLGVPVHVLTPVGKEFSLEPTERGLNIRIPAHEGVEAQASEVLRALARLAEQGQKGVYFTLAYRYVSVAGLHLEGSPWLPVPVVHGRSTADHDWILYGPYRRIIVPSRDHGRIIHAACVRRLGWIRSFRRVCVIPHGVVIPATEKVMAKWACPCNGTLQIAVVSRLDVHHKRPWDYLRIAQQLVLDQVSFRMRILGDGPCEMAMRDSIREYGLETVVRMEGAVNAAGVSDCLASSHILLSASDSEAFGLSIAEALAHSCVVVGTDIPGPAREMVNARTGILVPVGDIQAFSAAVLKLKQNWRGMRRKGIDGRTFIQEYYPVDRMLAGYCDFLSTVQGYVHPMPDWQPPGHLFDSPGSALTARTAGRNMFWRVVAGMRNTMRNVMHGKLNDKK